MNLQNPVPVNDDIFWDCLLPSNKKVKSKFDKVTEKIQEKANAVRHKRNLSLNYIVPSKFLNQSNKSENFIDSRTFFCTTSSDTLNSIDYEKQKANKRPTNTKGSKILSKKQIKAVHNTKFDDVIMFGYPYTDELASTLKKSQSLKSLFGAKFLPTIKISLTPASEELIFMNK